MKTPIIGWLDDDITREVAHRLPAAPVKSDDDISQKCQAKIWRFDVFLHTKKRESGARYDANLITLLVIEHPMCKHAQAAALS